MTKRELIEALSGYYDDDLVVIEVHDTTLHEDLYDFYVDSMKVGIHRGKYPGFDRTKHEIRLSAINHCETIVR